jgi:hypothetical protein
VRSVAKTILLGLAIGAGALLGWRFLGSSRVAPPDAPTVVEKVREVARLEALQVSLYKKITFAPEPTEAGSIWGDLAGWLRHVVSRPEGKAIVFAEARIGLDMGRLRPGDVVVHGREAIIVLPPLEAVVELRPGETEVIGSNLDSAETALLLEKAKDAFHREVMADRSLQRRARAAAEHALSSLLLRTGLDRVEFSERHPEPPRS